MDISYNDRPAVYRMRAGEGRARRAGAGHAGGAPTAARGSKGAGRSSAAGRGGTGRSPRRSHHTSGLMRYAADNRIVQAVYQFTTGSTRYLFYGLVVLAVGIGLYFPVRDLYTAYRTGDILERQLEVRNDYNEVLEDKVSRLLSTEGIEDIARENLGLVMPGERVVTVTGVEADESSSGDSLTASEVENAELAVVDDAPWYIKVLDAIFFYRGVEGQVVSSAREAESEEAASGASSEGETQAEEPSSEE